MEDIELGLRIASAGGGLIRLDPEIQGTHLKLWRLRTMLLMDPLHRGMPWTVLMLDRGPQAARLNLRGSHGVAALAFTLGLGAAAALRRFRLAGPLAALYFAINMRFYALMLRRAGFRGAGAAVALLAAHNAAARLHPTWRHGLRDRLRWRAADPRPTRLVMYVRPPWSPPLWRSPSRDGTIPG